MRLIPLILFFHAIAVSAMPLKVSIDPGHGGKDRGAVEGKARESEITLAVSQKLARRLSQDSRFKASLTRTGDEFLTLSQRVDRAERQNVDVLLSIHVNWSDDKRAHGLEVYFQNQLPPDEESMFLAARENQGESAASGPRHSTSLAEKLSPEVHLIVQDLLRNQRIISSSNLAKSIKRHWKGTKKSSSLSIRQAPFFVISNIEAPSALVEIGFLSHPTEGSKLLGDEYQDTIAQSLHEGLIDYQESLDKLKAPRLQ
jgi:N-acetylmuramoyl-L-alanine amidase